MIHQEQDYILILYLLQDMILVNPEIHFGIHYSDKNERKDTSILFKTLEGDRTYPTPSYCV